MVHKGLGNKLKWSVSSDCVWVISSLLGRATTGNQNSVSNDIWSTFVDSIDVFDCHLSGVIIVSADALNKWAMQAKKLNVYSRTQPPIWSFVTDLFPLCSWTASNLVILNWLTPIQSSIQSWNLVGSYRWLVDYLITFRMNSKNYNQSHGSVL